MPFQVCYYHVVWATKYRQAIITPSIEAVILNTIAEKSIELKSRVYAINTVPDHIHVAVAIAVNISVADWVQRAKGVSSYEVNTMYPDLDPRFGWQAGYGVLTFGEKRLPYVVDYVQRQKERHGINDLEDYLEQME